jgi:hypothetical protein
MLIAIGFQWRFDLHQHRHSPQHHGLDQLTRLTRLVLHENGLPAARRALIQIESFKSSHSRTMRTVTKFLSCIEITWTLGKKSLDCRHCSLSTVDMLDNEQCRRLIISCPKCMWFQCRREIFKRRHYSSLQQWSNSGPKHMWFLWRQVLLHCWVCTQ